MTDLVRYGKYWLSPATAATYIKTLEHGFVSLNVPTDFDITSLTEEHEISDRTIFIRKRDGTLAYFIGFDFTRVDTDTRDPLETYGQHTQGYKQYDAIVRAMNDGPVEGVKKLIQH